MNSDLIRRQGSRNPPDRVQDKLSPSGGSCYDNFGAKAEKYKTKRESCEVKNGKTKS